MTNKEQLMELLENRSDIIPILRDILAAERLTPKSYAQVFRLLYSTMAISPEDAVAFSKGTNEWRVGRKKLTDIMLFCKLGVVCDVIRYYVLTSWDECIFSAWVAADAEVAKAEADMEKMETSASIREIIKYAKEVMVYSSDGTINWGAGDTEADSVAAP